MNAKFLLSVMMCVLLIGCGDSTSSTSSAKDNWTLSQKIIYIETNQSLSDTDPLVVQTQAQLKQVAILTGLEQKKVGNMVMETKKLVNSRSDKDVTFFEIMNWLTTSEEVGLMLTGKGMKFEQVLGLYAVGA